MSAHRTSRACDGCRIRKVKCDGQQPCHQCVHFDVQCVVTPASKRKNPIRGRLVAKVRGEEHHHHHPHEAGFQDDSGHSPNSPSDARKSAVSPGSASFSPRALSLFDSLASSTAYTPAFFVGLLPQFEKLVYPVNPILDTKDVESAIANMHDSFEDAALVHAYGAVTTFLAQPDNRVSGLASAQVNEMMQLSLEAHKRADLRIGPNGHLIEESLVSIKRITTCIYLEIAMMAFKRFDRSFALLREGITMLQTLKADDAIPQGTQRPKFQRLYWEAFIHERFLTMHSGYPAILTPLVGLPDHDASLPPSIQVGFNRLISLFRIMDRRFVAYRVNEEADDESIPALDVHWVESRQAELDADEHNAEQAEIMLRMSDGAGLSESQHADIYVTRLWMRTVVWQLALSRGLLRSVPTTHEALSLHFPAQRLSTQLRTLVLRLDSMASISTQGSGIVQKLFEITNTIADVLTLPVGPDKVETELTAQVRDLVFLVHFLLGLERIRDDQRQYLLHKVRLLKERHPSVEMRGVT
ncbi:uncharacterized protein J7T54_007407 [Emericellopsis cladophorae]|uniref:Zn(2)-C6 fungal-type domain-containing protein n=1 Tax=Emericellopsis cladophorae TaxID=2686198 RepID=A0A9Q0BB10_9HYPO|nr:uncharacterized protein J7T54_007407 [Emericellopsis cladophorae]KAI6778010.1 hypothetical protein J7T54_007407 [Emericellopsis cladophorae]